jgi:hypothetical protein
MQGNAPSKFTRHEILARALRAMAGFALLALTGQPRQAAAAKAQKEDLAYQDRPNGGKSCASCRQFSPTAAGKGTCAVIEGEVSASGWCTAYSARDTTTSQGPSLNAAIRQARTNRVRNAAVPSTTHTEEGVHT